MNNMVSLLKPDVDVVIQGADQIRLDRWNIKLTAAGKPVEVIKILNIDVQEYYENHYSEIRTIDIAMGLGQYTNILYPGREEIVVNLQCIEAMLADLVDSGVISGYRDDEFYTGVLEVTGNEVLEDSYRTLIDTSSLDISSLKLVRLQLTNKTDEQIRLIQVGGSYRNTDIATVLKTIITNAVKSLDLEANYIPKGIELVEPDNTTLYDQIIIPDGTKLVDLPGYLQKHYGVYSNGLAHYLRNGIWHIFPTYDITRGGSAEYSLQVSIVPRQLYPELGRTYRKFGSSTLIISNGERHILENAIPKLANEGNGVKFFNTNFLLQDNTVKESPNKVVSNAAEQVNEYVAFENSNGINNLPVREMGLTANTYLVKSEISMRTGSYIMLEWRYSDPDLAIPGAIAKIRYEDNGSIKEFEGVLVSAAHSIQLYGYGVTAMNYTTQSFITFFVQRDLDLERINDELLLG
ncbi:MAG: hypothetical protein M0R77_01135 [Gammaproteobacteria bacterium]|nr:hypothetical protein [Acholeplasmataceae bacterium]MCK9529160.1 hypothetical protein [Gammaproteobacteria bacterium]